MAIQLTYTGTAGQRAVDIKINEDLSIRETLAPNVVTTLQNVTLAMLDGNPRWDALLADADITLTLTEGDVQIVEFGATFVAAGAPVDTPVVASMPFTGQVLSATLITTVTAGGSAINELNDGVAGAGTTIVSALDSTGLGQDAGTLGTTLVAAGTPVNLYRPAGDEAGQVVMQVLRTGN